MQFVITLILFGDVTKFDFVISLVLFVLSLIFKFETIS